jgi:hypothetical protein
MEARSGRKARVALLTRTQFRLCKGELHELQARVVEREAAALQRACDSYARFGMAAQAARVATELGGGSGSV